MAATAGVPLTAATMATMVTKKSECDGNSDKGNVGTCEPHGGFPYLETRGWCYAARP